MRKPLKEAMSVLAITGTLFGAMATFGADNGSSSQVNSDQTRNPVTGTVSDKDTYQKNEKRADGKEQNVQNQSTTKYKSDGTVEKDVDHKTTTTPAE